MLRMRRGLRPRAMARELAGARRGLRPRATARAVAGAWRRLSRLVFPRAAGATWLTLALVSPVLAAPAARLRATGWPLTSREAEALFAPALRAPADSAVLARALHRAETRLQSDGWLDATLTAAWDTARSALSLAATAGTRYRWRKLTVVLPSADSSALSSWLPWPADQPADPLAFGALVERALREAESRGHAWAQLAVTGWDADSGRVDVRLSGALGPRVRVSDVRVDGLHVTRPEVASRALGRLTGATYDPAAAKAAASRLSQLGVFSRAEFTGLEGGPQWEAGTLAFRVEEPRYNRFEGAVGVQGSSGVVGLASLDLGNLLGTARSASLGWRSRGAGRSDFHMRYSEPQLAGLPFRLELALAQELQDSTYTRTRWGGRLGTPLGGGDRIEAGYEEERVVQTRGEASTANLQNTVFAYERDARDDLVSPRRGSRLRLSGTGVFKRETLRAPLPGGPSTRRSRGGIAEARVEWHRPTAEHSGVALELGGIGRFSSESVLAEYERIPIGGAATLRGHDEEAFRVDRALTSRLEYRWFPGASGERVSLFWDHARMFSRDAVTDSTGAIIGDVANTRAADGVGFGLRLRAAGGLVDLDYGIEPGRGFLDGRLHLRLVSTF